jgi:hypothetical protein
MKTIFRVTVLLLVLLLFFQCQKEKMLEEDPCEIGELTTGSYFNTKYYFDFPIVVTPHFNPNNPDELVFLSQYQNSSTLNLTKYNWRTGEKEIIYSGLITGGPDWGMNDWILFGERNELGYNISRIRSNGEGYEQLTTSGNCFNPKWGKNAERLIYQFSGSPGKAIVLDSSGFFIDTTYTGASGKGSWDHSQFVASVIRSGLVVVDPYNKKYRRILDVEDGHAGGAEWLDEETIFWCHGSGVYVTDLETLETKTIRDTSCPDRNYRFPTYSPDINKVILEFYKSERLSDNEYKVSTHYVIMNPDGSEEEVLEIEVD